jgi:hypothetical protein
VKFKKNIFVYTIMGVILLTGLVFGLRTFNNRKNKKDMEKAALILEKYNEEMDRYSRIATNEINNIAPAFHGIKCSFSINENSMLEMTLKYPGPRTRQNMALGVCCFGAYQASERFADPIEYINIVFSNGQKRIAFSKIARVMTDYSQNDMGKMIIMDNYF